MWFCSASNELPKVILDVASRYKKTPPIGWRLSDLSDNTAETEDQAALHPLPLEVGGGGGGGLGQVGNRRRGGDLFHVAFYV